MEKLSVSKERVIEAANKCSTAKNILMVLFPEVFEVPKPKFKVGDWIIGQHGYCPHKPKRIEFIDSTTYYYNDDEWSAKLNPEKNNTNNGCGPDYARLATKEEIEKHLIALAEKKGFKEGVKVNEVKPTYNGNVCKNGFTYYPHADVLYGGIKGEGGPLLYSKGQWAEIIQEPKQYTFTRNQCGDITEISFKADSEKDALERLGRITGDCASKYELKTVLPC